MDADVLIDFDRRLHVRYLGKGLFELWTTGSGEVEVVVRFQGSGFRALINLRHTIVSEPVRLSRDGTAVVIQCGPDSPEWGRLRSESFRDLVSRAVRLRN